MALAVCLLFDAAGDRTIRQLWCRLEARGLSTPLSHTHRRHRPHLSLAVLRSWELPAVLGALSGLPVAEPVHLQFQGVLAFPRGRVSLATAVGADLYRRQEAIARALLAAGLDLHKYYLPGRWIPHVSVATREVRSNCRRWPSQCYTIPIHADAVQAALIDSSTGESWPLP